MKAVRFAPPQARFEKAVFLDRDGTIIKETGYLYKPKDVVFLPGAVDALCRLRAAGCALIVITNQSGIGRGYYKEDDYLALTHWLNAELEKQDARIDAFYACPHHPDAGIGQYRMVCGCRKPAVGLFERAVRDFGLDLNRCIAIGGRLRDCAICGSTACRGFLIGQTESPETLTAVKAGLFRNIRYAGDLAEAAELSAELLM